MRYRLLETRYNPNRHMARHAHDDAIITLALRGRVREDGRQSEFDAGAGDVAVKPAGAIHTDWFGPTGMTTLTLRFAPDAGAAITINRAAYGWIEGGPIVRAMTQLLRHQRESGDGLATDAAVCDVLATLPGDPAREEVGAPPWVRRARDRLHDDPAPTRVNELADECGVHPVHLTRQFRLTYGVGVSEYLQRLRARRAAQLLTTTTPLAVVAAQAGFADQAHMTRTFRRRYGVTPARYRRLIHPA